MLFSGGLLVLYSLLMLSLSQYVRRSAYISTRPATLSAEDMFRLLALSALKTYQETRHHLYPPWNKEFKEWQMLDEYSFNLFLKAQNSEELKHTWQCFDEVLYLNVQERERLEASIIDLDSQRYQKELFRLHARINYLLVKEMYENGMLKEKFEQFKFGYFIDSGGEVLK